MADTMARIPQRIQVEVRTAAGFRMPEAIEAAIICRVAISRNTIECTSAMTARLRFVRTENSPIYACQSTQSAETAK